MSFLVLFIGHAASGKTTLAYAVSPALGAGLITTSSLGDFIADRADPGFIGLRSLRYERALTIAKSYLEMKLPVVMDGTYSLATWRRAVFELAQEFEVRNIVIVLCECRDSIALSRRFSSRRANADLPDSRASSMDAYLGSSEEYERFELAEEIAHGIDVGLVSVNTFTGTVTLVRETSLAARVTELLNRAVVPERDSGGVVIALEGIGGSGKTTLSLLLRDRLAERPQSKVALCPEFSSSALGRFIEASRAGGPRVLPHFQNSLSVNAMLLVDWLTQTRLVAGAADWTIVDSGWMSHAAHMSAISQRGDRMPEDVWRELVLNAANLMREQIGRIAPRLVTFFLDCPPDLAWARISSRDRSVTAADQKLLERLDAEYRSIISQTSEVIRIDASRPSTMIVAEVHDFVLARGRLV